MGDGGKVVQAVSKLSSVKPGHIEGMSETMGKFGAQ
jgi:hypothetical protein